MHKRLLCGTGITAGWRTPRDSLGSRAYCLPQHWILLATSRHHTSHGCCARMANITCTGATPACGRVLYHRTRFLACRCQRYLPYCLDRLLTAGLGSFLPPDTAAILRPGALLTRVSGARVLRGLKHYLRCRLRWHAALLLRASCMARAITTALLLAASCLRRCAITSAGAAWTAISRTCAAPGQPPSCTSIIFLTPLLNAPRTSAVRKQLDAMRATSVFDGARRGGRRMASEPRAARLPTNAAWRRPAKHASESVRVYCYSTNPTHAHLHRHASCRPAARFRRSPPHRLTTSTAPATGHVRHAAPTGLCSTWRRSPRSRSRFPACFNLPDSHPTPIAALPLPLAAPDTNRTFPSRGLPYHRLRHPAAVPKPSHAGLSPRARALHHAHAPLTTACHAALPHLLRSPTCPSWTTSTCLPRPARWRSPLVWRLSDARGETRCPRTTPPHQRRCPSTPHLPFPHLQAHTTPATALSTVATSSICSCSS